MTTFLTTDQPSRIDQAWNTVARYRTYEGAQTAVDRLAKDGFPVEELSIVGSNLQLDGSHRKTMRYAWISATPTVTPTRLTTPNDLRARLPNGGPDPMPRPALPGRLRRSRAGQ